MRVHWGVENQVHWCLDVAFKDDQMCAREKSAGANLATLWRFVLKLFRQGKTPKKGGLYNRCILGASSDQYRAKLLGLNEI